LRPNPVPARCSHGTWGMGFAGIHCLNLKFNFKFRQFLLC
jgi:hypothetical protein